MSALYDLWDLDSGNRLATYVSRAEALAAVRDLAMAHPHDYGDSLSLAFIEGPGESTLVAQGSELVRLAREVEERSQSNARIYSVAQGYTSSTGSSVRTSLRGEEEVGSIRARVDERFAKAHE